MPRQFGKETVKGIFEREPEKIPDFQELRNSKMYCRINLYRICLSHGHAEYNLLNNAVSIPKELPEKFP